MSRESRLGLDSWVPLGAGLGWLWLGARHGGAGFALALLPGILLVSSAGAGLVWREDDRVLRFVALGAAIGVAVTVPAAFLYSVAGAVGLLAGSVASFVAAGHASLRQDPPRRDVPAAPPSVAMSVRVAIDEVVLAVQCTGDRGPRGVARGVQRGAAGGNRWGALLRDRRDPAGRSRAVDVAPRAATHRALDRELGHRARRGGLRASAARPA